VTGRNADRGQRSARSLGERVRFRTADITDPDAADGVMDACVASFGALDAVVNSGALDHTDELVAYLVSDDSRYVTDTTSKVDGGYTAQ
jgi:NAD(P)-dependent dehydrogenase (short-subunit alcohol dehydrogenase family)